MKLYALLCAYNCDETFFDCLTALAYFVDVILILEGRWIGYEGTSLVSTDDTRNEFLRFISSQPWNTKVELRYMAMTEQMHQYEARNFLVEQVPEGDWFLMVDSDEIFTSWARDTVKLLTSLTVEGTRGLCIYSYDEVEKTQSGRRMDLPKMFRKTKGMHMTKNHRYYDDDSGPIVYNHRDFPEAPVFVFKHRGSHKKMRPVMEQYKNWLVKFESSFNKDMSDSEC
jgi:hypothetical protein